MPRGFGGLRDGHLKGANIIINAFTLHDQPRVVFLYRADVGNVIESYLNTIQNSHQVTAAWPFQNCTKYREMWEN